MLATHTHTTQSHRNTSTRAHTLKVRAPAKIILCKPSPDSHAYMRVRALYVYRYIFVGARIYSPLAAAALGYTNLIIHYKLDEKFLIKVYCLVSLYVYLYILYCIYI